MFTITGSTDLSELDNQQGRKYADDDCKAKMKHLEDKSVNYWKKQNHDIKASRNENKPDDERSWQNVSEDSVLSPRSGGKKSTIKHLKDRRAIKYLKEI